MVKSIQKLERFKKRYRTFNKMRNVFYTLILLSFFSCKGTESRVNKTQEYFNLDSIHTDYLVSFSDDGLFSPGKSCGYRNSKGEISIPQGKYNYCFTDTFRNFAFVSDDKLTNSKVVAIDRNENILFDVYMFDNGPDWLVDGLFRVVRNGKIGYANNNGIIIIEPKYECAEQFEKGIARVALNCTLKKDRYDPEHYEMEGGAWSNIDKKGDEVK
ncbi:MAG: WG repeat-containing protein [Ignavibacteriales bacterium]|nr:WG repeat-containing protein [Ignavibacteriales bacterium]